MRQNKCNLTCSTETRNQHTRQLGHILSKPGQVGNDKMRERETRKRGQGSPQINCKSFFSQFWWKRFKERGGKMC